MGEVRQKIQLELALRAAGEGEARTATRRGTDSLALLLRPGDLHQTNFVNRSVLADASASRVQKARVIKAAIFQGRVFLFF
jgi:hypothetical protein